ncbi:MAG: hypothetical protein H6704_04505 [Myxococcales bacterium]|nr:hypothetical protein [Myxococcales bacterium]
MYALEHEPERARRPRFLLGAGVVAAALQTGALALAARIEPPSRVAPRVVETVSLTFVAPPEPAPAPEPALAPEPAPAPEPEPEPAPKPKPKPRAKPKPRPKPKAWPKPAPEAPPPAEASAPEPAPGRAAEAHADRRPDAGQHGAGQRAALRRR